MATKPSEQQFAQLVKEQKSTIYTVCYMFSKDEDEVADLFEEVLVNLWKGFQEFPRTQQPAHMGLPRESEHMHLGRPKEEAAEDDTAKYGHQPL